MPVIIKEKPTQVIANELVKWMKECADKYDNTFSGAILRRYSPRCFRDVKTSNEERAKILADLCSPGGCLENFQTKRGWAYRLKENNDE